MGWLKKAVRSIGNYTKRSWNSGVDRLGGMSDYMGDAYDSGMGNIKKDLDPVMDPTQDMINNLTGKTLVDDMRKQALAEQKRLEEAEEQARLDAQGELDKERRKRSNMKGKESTILTGPLGAIAMDIQKKALLGR